MCNRLPEIKKNGDAGIFPVYYSLKHNIGLCAPADMVKIGEAQQKKGAKNNG